MIEIEAPDGSVVEFPDGMSDDAISAAMRKAYPAPKMDRPASSLPTVADMRALVVPGYTEARQRLASEDALTGRSPVRGLGDFVSQAAGSTGVMDEVKGGARSLLQGAENLGRRALGRPVVIPMKAMGQAAIDAERERQADYARQNPGKSLLATALGIATTGKPVTVPTAISPLRAGATVAALNAPFAVGRQKGGVAERLPGAALETGLALAFGAGGQAAGNALARRAVARAAAPLTAARKLSDQGVQLTPGQMLGGTAQRLEDALVSVPITGDAIRSAKVRGLESFDRAALNRTLEPIGQALPKNVNVGRDGVREVSGRISQAYQRALNGVQVAPDAQYLADVTAAQATPNLTAAQRETLNTIIGDLNSRFNGPVSGEAWKLLDSDLGKYIRAADNASASQPGGAILRNALQQLRGAHQALLGRTAPQAAQAVQAADLASANLARVREASQYVGTSARNGVFSPADLSRAVRGMDTSAGNRAFAQGDALMQDLTDPAMQVLPPTVPDSGTALRSLVSTLGLTGGGVALGASPAVVGAGLGAAVGGAGLYSRPAVAAYNAIFRAVRPGQASEALSRLAQLAARDPGAVPLYQEALQRLGVLQPPVAGQRTPRPVQSLPSR